MITPINPNANIQNYTPQKQVQKFASSTQTSEANLKYLNAYYPTKINFRGNEVGVEERVNDLLSNKEYDFETPNGEKVKGTIKDFIQACIYSTENEITSERLLHGTSGENRENILENGFDTSKVSRSVCGPGISCTGSEDEAFEIGGGAVIQFKFKGSSARTQHKFYEKIQYNNEITNDLDEIFGGGLKKASEEKRYSSDEYNEARGKINGAIASHVRHVLVDELGIDSNFDHGSRVVPPCFVIYNTDKIYDLEKYN